MPGDNCSVVGCGTCRRTKGIGIWKLPAARNEAYRKWRKDWLNELTKYRLRVADKDFQRQIENDKVFTCEKNFHESDIELLFILKVSPGRRDGICLDRTILSRHSGRIFWQSKKIGQT